MSDIIKMFEAPYAEENDLLNDYIEKIIKRVSWKLFENQQDIVFMTYETENNIPQLKEEAIEVIRRIVNSELSWLRGYIINRILVSYAKNNIDLGDMGRWYINEQLDLEDIADFWKEIDEFIWHDYVQYLGEERTEKLWEKWGKEPLEG